MPSADVIVVGGGPAGLATSIALAARGLAVTVLERQGPAPDKACGEGLLPPALEALDLLGARGFLDPAETSPIDGIRYVDADGRVAEGRLPSPGLVVRRTALAAALEARARAAGVDLRHHARATDVSIDAAGVTVSGLRARMLVAADGLHSPIRRAAGLDRATRAPRRFGLRQHVHAPAPDAFVEVHFAPGVEAYVAGCGPGRTNVTFLWDDARAPSSVTIPDLLARFPRLAARLDGAAPASSPRGAGPMSHRAHAAIADRLALVGDAAGYVDAITGEGLSIALHGALALGRTVPDALVRNASAASLLPYQVAFDALFLRYLLVTRAVLSLARHPRARHHTISALARFPRAFDRLLAWTVA